MGGPYPQLHSQPEDPDGERREVPRPGQAHVRICCGHLLRSGQRHAAIIGGVLAADTPKARDDALRCETLGQ